MCILESDIHGSLSTVHRIRRFSKEEVLDQLHIEGYTLHLPDTWVSYHQARLIVFVRNDIKIVRRPMPFSISDLPTITFEVGLGKERKSLFYVLL